MHNPLHSAGSPISGAHSEAASLWSRLGRMLRRTRHAGMAAAALGLTTIGATAARADDGAGVQARIGHIEGQGIPQVLPVTPLELFPYYESDGQLLFSDLRLVITNDGTFGGNMGFGYRFFEPETDRIYGGSFWYDLDDTRELLFQQVGLSLESYGTDFDVRGNVYLPVGPESRQDSLTLVPGSLQFQNQNMIYTQNRSWYTSMKGLDGEFGIPVPGSIAESIDLRVYGGGYFYHNSYHDIPGVSTRVQAAILPGLDATVQVTYDSFFETRAFAGISWTFGPLHYSNFERGDAMGRLGEHVTRNYTVVATHQRQYESVVATNPTTRQAYRFAHVSSSAAPGGSGAVDDPFNTIAAAQTTSPDVVFVHAGSVFSGSDAQVVMFAGERLLGDGNGVQHPFLLPELGTVFAPRGPTSGALPILQNTTGDAVVLASHSELSGFTISNPSGRGVFGNGVNQAQVRNVVISGGSSHGVELANTSGDVRLENLFVTGTTLAGIRVSGNGGTTRFTGTTHVTETGGAAVSLANLGSASSVTFDTLLVEERFGRGLEADNVSGSVTVNGTAQFNNENNSLASAVDIRNSSGSFAFNTLQATGVKGSPGVNLQDNTGTTSIQTVNITSDGATGLRARNAGTLKINPVVNNAVDLSKGGTITAVNGTAVDIEGTALDVNLQSVNSSGAGANPGIRLVSDTGVFAVWGGVSGSDGTGGTIEGAATGVFLKDVDSVGFKFMHFDGNGTGIDAENVKLLFLNNSQVVNSTSFGLDAVDLQTLNIANSIFRENSGVNVNAQFSKVLAYSYTFDNSLFVSKTADNVFLTSTGGGAGSSLNLVSSHVQYDNTTLGAAGMRVNWNGALAGTIDANVFNGTGGTNTGLAITNTGTTLTNLAVTNNIFTFTNGNGTAVNLNTASSSQLSLVNNLVELSGGGGTGFRFTGVNPTFTLTSNTVHDVSGGSTGFLFDSLTGPGSVTINNNLIDLAPQTALLDRGIIFSNVTNTIQLFGTQDNKINNAAVDLSVPAGTTTGTVKINGVNKP